MAHAIIMAAGLGSRMKEVTTRTPKPLVMVHGESLISTLINAFLHSGIRDITVVRGYKKDAFDSLLLKYPFLRFVDNDEFDKGNNILSLLCAQDLLGDCYIAEADFLVSDASIIEPNPKNTFYLGYPTARTEDWCFENRDGFASNYRKGGRNVYQAIGISYWTKQDGALLKERLLKRVDCLGGRDTFWEETPLVFDADLFRIRIKEIKKDSIVEIDSLDELIQIDSSYKKFQGEKK